MSEAKPIGHFEGLVLKDLKGDAIDSEQQELEKNDEEWIRLIQKQKNISLHPVKTEEEKAANIAKREKNNSVWDTKLTEIAVAIGETNRLLSILVERGQHSMFKDREAKKP